MFGPQAPCQLLQAAEGPQPWEPMKVASQWPRCQELAVKGFFIHRHRMLRPQSPHPGLLPPLGWYAQVFRSLEVFEDPKTGNQDSPTPFPAQPQGIRLPPCSGSPYLSNEGPPGLSAAP